MRALTAYRYSAAIGANVQRMHWAFSIVLAALCAGVLLGCHRVDYSPMQAPQAESDAQETGAQVRTEAHSADESDVPSDLAAYCRSLRNSSDPFFGTQQRTRLLAELQRPTFDTDSWRISIMGELARDHLRFGEADQAIRLLRDALDIEERRNRDARHQAVLLQDLAVANLKMGELRNCVSPDGRLMCVLPLDAAHSHTDATGSRAAIGYLMRLLDLEPSNLRAMWLLNIAHMTLGTYPDGIPERFRIPPMVFQSEQSIGRFDEIAPLAGLYAVSTAGGAIIEDFDNDGLLDVMTSTWDACKLIAYYRSGGDGRFVDSTQQAGLSGQLGGLNIVQTDYDNDGWMDVLVMRGGWMGERGQVRRSLLRNTGDGTFADVTEAVGLAKPAYPSQSAAWGDYDNDGDLDMFSCNETMRESGTESAALMFPSQLFRNDGAAGFMDVANDAGVQNWRFCKGSAWGDYDNDGDLDLYISNFGDANRLYRNDGDGGFTDVAADAGVTQPLDSFAVWFWDYDNDGSLDLFVAGYGEDIESVARDYMGVGGDAKRARSRLYRNDGSGGFDDVSQAAGVDGAHMAMGANFGDLDSDGFPDFYLGTGAPSYDAIVPNRMYRNIGGMRFADVTHAGGFGHLQKGHGVSFGDLDRDGDQDIFAQVGGFYPGDGFVNALYRNPGHGNSWLSVKLVGVQSNAAAIGTRLKVTLDMADGTVREVHAHVSSGGSFGASTLTQELGLGQAKRIRELEVRWQASGVVQRFSDVPLDSHIRIHEGTDDYEVRNLPPIPLGVGVP